MLRRILIVLVALALLGAGLFWFLTRPQTLSEEALAGLDADPARGEYVFRAAGCASCHAAPGAPADTLELGGGLALKSPFGTFYAPNISPDPGHGIGNWTALQFVNAVRMGVAPDGQHLYPAFPYASYVRMTNADAVSLFAYLRTLPPVATPSKPHEIGFPFSWRRLLGGWKLLNFREGWVVDPVPAGARDGRYLAEALAHCGECHTPRDALGGLRLRAWLGGAPNLAGPGKVPNITPGRLDWSEADLVSFFQSGLTPEFEGVGGDMAKVIAHLQTLPEADLVSLAAYLKAVPAAPK